jgi:hypothetical protein
MFLYFIICRDSTRQKCVMVKEFYWWS